MKKQNNKSEENTPSLKDIVASDLTSNREDAERFADACRQSQREQSLSPADRLPEEVFQEQERKEQQQAEEQDQEDQTEGKKLVMLQPILRALPEESPQEFAKRAMEGLRQSLNREPAISDQLESDEPDPPLSEE